MSTKLLLFTITLLFVLFALNYPNAPVAYANSISDVNDDYRAYWTENRGDIHEAFDNYVAGFHEGCIDHEGLRNLLVKSESVYDTASDITAEDELDIVYGMHKFVYASIKYADVDDNLNAEDVLNLGEGDCSERSVLLYSLLEASGVKSYIANGDNHRYVWAKIEGIWIPIDTTSSDIFFIYKNWDSDRYVSMQPFLVNRTHTLFNNDWC